MKFFKTDWMAMFLMLGTFVLCCIYLFRVMPAPDTFTMVPDHREETASPTQRRPPPVYIPDGRLNINAATLDDLTSLKGIGQTKALAILKYRRENGPFQSVEELMNVSGIGPATFQKIALFVTVLEDEDD